MKFHHPKIIGSINERMSKMKILVTEHMAQEGIQYLREKGYRVDNYPDIRREQLLDIIHEYEGLIVRSVTKVDEELMDRALQLKAVGRAGNGVDNIDLKAATQKGVIVLNTPESNTVSTAEHTIALLLASSRNIPQADAHIKGGQWNRNLFRGVELNGKILGIVGLGRIGSMVATRMQAFGMEIIAYDPYIQHNHFEKLGVRRVASIEELMGLADFITIHTPKTKETVGIIGRKEFEIAKKGVRVVNCARGGLIDEKALYEAIKAGIVHSCGIDVLVSEPNPVSPLLDLENVIFTPHLGADTHEAQINVGVTVAKELDHALRGEIVNTAVNMPAIKQSEYEAVKLYMTLAEKLGRLYYQLEKEAIEKVSVFFAGDVTKIETETITLAFLKGLFEPILGEGVNYVNARYVAKERSIEIIESMQRDNENYTNLIEVHIATKTKNCIFAGTVLGKKGIRIVQVNGFECEVEPTAYMLLAENRDQPGVIGKIGMALGQGGFNINTMKVSQNDNFDGAMMFLTVDRKVDAHTLLEIEQINGINKVKFVTL